MISYPARIEYKPEDKSFFVDFPDLPGCYTYGESLDDAKIMAKEALTGYLESIDSRKIKIPEPSVLSGVNIYYIQPEKNVSFAIWLKKTRETAGLTQKQVAEKLDIKYQVFQKIENPEKSNPTLKTILKIEKVLGKQILQF